MLLCNQTVCTCTCSLIDSSVNCKDLPVLFQCKCGCDFCHDVFSCFSNNYAHGQTTYYAVAYGKIPGKRFYTHGKFGNKSSVICYFFSKFFVFRRINMFQSSCKNINGFQSALQCCMVCNRVNAFCKTAADYI